MKAFITGIAGFAGSHLAEFLLAHTSLEVSGLVHHRTDNIAHLNGQLTLRPGNLLDPPSLREVLSELRPDYVFHLAGQAFVPFSCSTPWETFEENVRSQLNLLEAGVALIPKAKFLIVGSGEEYGVVPPENLPIDEHTPLRPESPYGVSKVAQDMMGLQYYLSCGLWVVRVRPFNHIGPRQSERFVASSFAKQIAEIEAGLRPPVIGVGNLEAKRDFTDVRDTVRAYYLVLERGEPGEVYNIGSGVARSVAEILHLLLSWTNLEVKVQVEANRLRSSDAPISYCDYSRLHRCTGWKPQVPFEQGLRDTLEYWRTKIREGTRKALL